MITPTVSLVNEIRDSSAENENKKIKGALWVVNNGNIKDDNFVNVLILNKKVCLNDTTDSKEDKLNKTSHISENQFNAPIPKSFLCSKCGKGFSSNFNLKRHMTSCKLCPDDEKAPRYLCECGRTYAQEWDMKKHKASCQQNVTPGKSKCKKCPECSMLFYHRLQLQTHMKLTHNVTVEDSQVYDFESFGEFKIWKEAMEEDTYTYYSKQTGGNVTGVSVNTYYVCQHDGSDRTHGSSPRKTERRNKKGRVKTGMTCWSQMNVKEFRDGTVRVTYHPSHTHPVKATDTKHHPLPPSINEEIHRRIVQVNEAEPEIHEELSPDAKKAKRKGYSLNARNLRALARKNRKLFRITAEAINDAEEVRQTENDNDPTEMVLPREMTAQQCEVKTEDVTTSVLASNWHCSQLKAYLESGRLSASTLFQTESTLSSLVDSCRRDVLSTEELSGNGPDYSSTDEPIDSQPVYQVVALASKDAPSSSQADDLMYQNAVDLVGHRGLILITHDAQVYNSDISSTKSEHR